MEGVSEARTLRSWLGGGEGLGKRCFFVVAGGVAASGDSVVDLQEGVVLCAVCFCACVCFWGMCVP